MKNMMREAEEFLIIFEDLVEKEEYEQKVANEKFEYTACIERKNKEIEFLRSTSKNAYFLKIFFNVTTNKR